MQRFVRSVCLVVVLSAGWAGRAQAQKALTWDEVRQRFEANNPTLRAGQIGVDESKAQEITAYLRPNPQLTLTGDGTQIAPYHGVWRPFAGTEAQAALSYLARTPAQTGTAFGESAEGHRHCGFESE